MENLQTASNPDASVPTTSFVDLILPTIADINDSRFYELLNYYNLGLRHPFVVEKTSTAKKDKFRDTDRESLKQEVYELLKHAGTENWDEEGALALDPVTVDTAQRLIDKFPSYIVRPDVAATPHGEIDFDWVVSRDVMLTVSICPSKEIAFAGLFHGAQLRGREQWIGALPQFVNCCFERLRESQSE